MIPEYVYKISEILESNKFDTYLIGGSVRNMLLGHKPKDYDLTTSAHPEEIAKLFPRSVMTNAKFGTVTVLFEDDNKELQEVEITTFRSEKDYAGGRWPSHVEFGVSLEEDLKRRDFTINAMALRLVKIESGKVSYNFINSSDDLHHSTELIDLYDGLSDIKNRIIRCVGDPIERMKEDGLRAMRACRIASIYGFTIEENTLNAIRETWEVAAQISAERIRDEFMQMILKSPKPSVGLELMRVTGLLKLYIPELLEGYKMEHNKFHVHDVYQHFLDTVDIAPAEIRLAALFHDIGKPRSKEGEHFYGHDRVGAEMTKEILQRLKFPKKQIEETVNLVRWHMFFIPNTPHTETNDEDHNVRKTTFQNGWSDAAIRRLIRRVGGHEQLDKLLKLRIADASANPKSSFDPKEVNNLSERIAKIREKEAELKISSLMINGHDLMDLGINEGKEIRKILEDLLERVIEDIELNEKEKLIEIVKKEYVR